MKGGRTIEVQYHNSKVKKLCQDYKKAKIELNVEVAEKLHSLIGVLESADNLWDINQMRIYNLHPLQGDREGQYALDLGRRLGFRLVIIPLDENGNELEKKDFTEKITISGVIFADEFNSFKKEIEDLSNARILVELC